MCEYLQDDVKITLEGINTLEDVWIVRKKSKYIKSFHGSISHVKHVIEILLQLAI